MATTSNFNFNLIDFDKIPWHSDEHDNWHIVDALMQRYISVSNIQGVWQNALVIAVGDRYIDEDSDTIWEALAVHTTPSTGTFSASRTAVTTNWQTITVDQIFAGTWTAGKTYTVNSFIVDGTRYGVVLVDHTAVTSYDSGVTNEYILTLIDIAMMSDGTELLPARSFIADPDTGIWRPTGNQLAISTGGVRKLLVADDASWHEFFTGGANLGLKITNTNSGTVGSVLSLHHDPDDGQSDGDIVGIIDFEGDDDASTPLATTYTRVQVTATDVSAGTVDGLFEVIVPINSTLATRARIGAGLAIGPATNALKGDGTINCDRYYLDGVDCAFLAYNTVTDSNVTGNATSVSPVEFDTEIFDNDADYNNTTDTFAAPIDGLYLLRAGLLLGGVTTETQVLLELVTSNRVYRLDQTNLGAIDDSSNQYYTAGSVLVDMQAADTASIRVSANGSGGDTVDIIGDSTPITFFSGHLVTAE
jgi:hypothetical protein